MQRNPGVVGPGCMQPLALAVFRRQARWCLGLKGAFAWPMRTHQPAPRTSVVPLACPAGKGQALRPLALGSMLNPTETEFMCDLAWGRHDRVSGRSPEWAAKGAQRPSGRQTGLGRQAHIGHPVLVVDGISGSALEAIWQGSKKALEVDRQGFEKAPAGDRQATGSELQRP